MRANDDIAQERLSQVADHMAGGTGSSTGSSSLANKKGKSSLLEKNPDDVSTIHSHTGTIQNSSRFTNNYPRSS
jgi:hypothetical protein